MTNDQLETRMNSIANNQIHKTLKQASLPFYKRWVTVLVAVGLFTVGQAFGDQRWYTWTYGASVLERGEIELEHTSTFTSLRNVSTNDNLEVEHQLELERGVTDRLDLGLYQIIHQHTDRNYFYEGYKLRLRYLLPVEVPYFSKPVLYLEFANVSHLKERVLEGKFILERNVGAFNLAWNLGLERALQGESSEKLEFQFNQGLSWRVNKRFRIGGEILASNENLYVGPVVSMTGGEFSVLIGTAFSLWSEETPKQDHLRLMLIMEL